MNILHTHIHVEDSSGERNDNKIEGKDNKMSCLTRQYPGPRDGEPEYIQTYFLHYFYVLLHG